MKFVNLTSLTNHTSPILTFFSSYFIIFVCFGGGPGEEYSIYGHFTSTVQKYVLQVCYNLLKRRHILFGKLYYPHVKDYISS